MTKTMTEKSYLNKMGTLFDNYSQLDSFELHQFYEFENVLWRGRNGSYDSKKN